MPAPPSPLPPTVRALGWTSFLTDLCSEAIDPLLPGFVKGLGGQEDVGQGDRSLIVIAQRSTRGGERHDLERQEVETTPPPK